MKGLDKVNKFKNLKFRSVSYNKIECAVQLLKKLGYEEIHSDFSVYDAAKHNGICAWDDGEITEGWLEDSDFKTVTIEDLKEMVGETEEVLWLNKNTLEEKYLESGSVIKGIDWVEVPEGATFATGDKDNSVFRKDGWYYDNQNNEWVKSDVTIQNLHNHEFVKLFWIKGGKDSVFTLDRLLGCEVLFENRYQSSKGYITSFDNSCSVTLSCGVIITVPNLSNLTFFTEDGDELTFEEYVQLYYPKG